MVTFTSQHPEHEHSTCTYYDFHSGEVMDGDVPGVALGDGVDIV